MKLIIDAVLTAIVFIFFFASVGGMVCAVVAVAVKNEKWKEKMKTYANHCIAAAAFSWAICLSLGIHTLL